MEYDGIKKIVESVSENTLAFSNRLSSLLSLITKELLGVWNQFFVKSKLNTGFSSLDDFFNTIRVYDLRQGSFSDKYYLLVNIELYTTLLLCNIEYLSINYRREYLDLFIKVVKNACSYLGYEIIFEGTTGEYVVKIVKNNNLVTNDKESTEIIHSYYNYSKVDDISFKRECLKDLSNKLEPFRNNNPHLKQAESFVFKIFNNYNIRHNNNKESSNYNPDLDTFTEKDYIAIYDVTFNSAISLFSLYK
jgi:hypothetical protein